MTYQKEKTEAYATSQIERNITLSLEKPQIMMTRSFSHIRKVLYFVATQMPLPTLKIEDSIKQSMQKFINDTWLEVENYYSEIENEYADKYKEKQLPSDSYLCVKSSSEKEFKLMVNCPAVSRFINLIVRYDILLKKIDYYWLTGHLDDVARLQISKLLDNKLGKLISNISIVNKALITKQFNALGFGGTADLRNEEIDMETEDSEAENDDEISPEDQSVA